MLMISFHEGDRLGHGVSRCSGHGQNANLGVALFGKWRQIASSHRASKRSGRIGDETVQRVVGAGIGT